MNPRPHTLQSDMISKQSHLIGQALGIPSHLQQGFQDPVGSSSVSAQGDQNLSKKVIPQVI